MNSKRILELRDNYTVIDIETTGLNPGLDEIIEMTALRVRNNQITNTYSTLVKPSHQIPPFIEELTGITNEMVSEAPTLNIVLPDFISFIGDDVILGHNVSFDINFISEESKLLLGYPIENNYINTLSLARKAFPHAQNHKLKTLSILLGLKAPTHRAETDTLCTKELYDAIRKAAIEQNIDLFARQLSHSKLKASDIKTEKTDFDDGHPYYGKVCVFTGALSFPRRKAMQMVIDVGGINGDSVTKETDFLIVGSTDYIASLKGQKSSKLKKAEKLISEGQDIHILTEDTFLSLF